MFTDEIRESYRVVTTTYGNDESEETIPLGSWRKGGKLAGKKGHVYVKGEPEAGVWLFARYRTFQELARSVPSIRITQLGLGEMTFSVPWSDLPRLLPLIGAKRRFKASEAQLAAAKKGFEASPMAKSAKK